MDIRRQILNMPQGKLKVLLIVEQCNPEWASVPLEGFRYYSAVGRLVECDAGDARAQPDDWLGRGWPTIP